MAISYVGGSSPLARGGPLGCVAVEQRPGLIPARAGRTAIRPSTHWWSRAHPRSRGADIRRTARLSPSAGSSPLARGGPEHEVGVEQASGLIPARAGRTHPAPTARHTKPAHPRSRGADVMRDGARAQGDGSSPLARGGPTASSPGARSAGLIPARAGRTLSSVIAEGHAPAHPRSRGADDEMDDDVARRWGSSPLARGGHEHVRREPVGDRLIPARAGRTRHRPSSIIRPRAHPRSRGADPSGDPGGGLSAGSSPLARGGRGSGSSALTCTGLIPARAGRTRRPRTKRRRSEAHPRSRGADRTQPHLRTVVSGSSPLARGGPAGYRALGLVRGLIPARAGRTLCVVEDRPVIRAHPRSRGADATSAGLVARLTGSSPLARGGLPEPSRRG